MARKKKAKKEQGGICARRGLRELGRRLKMVNGLVPPVVLIVVGKANLKKQ
jgi:hypothetical protein